MKKTWLTMLAVGAIMCSPVMTFAQDGELSPPPPHEEDMRPEMKKDHQDRFAKELGLTDEQKVQAEKIRQAGREKMKPLMEKMKTLRKEMDELRKANMQEFEKILTPEQQTKLKDMKAKMDKKMKKEHRPDGKRERGKKGHGPKKD